MPVYISLYRWTDQGIKNVKNSPARLEAGLKAAEAMGIKSIGTYITMGQYDLITIGEAPNEETIAMFALAIGAQGNVHTETLRAFTTEEFHQIVDALP